MINSPANGRTWQRRAGFCVLMLALSLPFSARDTLAQGAPKPLLPSLGAPKPLLPPAAGTPAVTDSDTGPVEAAPGQPPANSGAAKAKAGISVNTLDTVSRESVGTIGSDESALPASMWDGTPRSTIQRMLALVGEAPATSSLRALMLRILLSPASIPQAADPTDRTSVVKARIDALERLGAWPDYIRLLELAPTADEETTLSPAMRARLKTDAGFLTGDTGTSCAIARDAMLSVPEDRYWQKAGTFCQALADEWESVEFNLRLLLELGDQDARYIALMRAVSGTTSDIPQMPEAAQLRPLDIAMMRVAGIAPAMPDPDAVPPSLIPVLTSFKALRFEDRLRLAERGEQLGLVDRSELIALYELVDIDPSQMQNALTAAAADPSANGRALLFRAIASQTLPLARAQAIQQALNLGRGEGRYGATARLYAPLIQEIPTTSPYAWFAADAASAFIAANMDEAAMPWLEMAGREARLGPEQATAWRDAVIMSRLSAGEDVPLEKNFLREWWRGIRNIAPENAPARATLLFGLLEATGAETPGTVWRGLIDQATPKDTKSPPPALLWARRDAARNGRLGEGALLTVLSLSGADLLDYDAGTLTESVRALSDLGLEKDAYRLALDIYLAASSAPAPTSSGE
ncbi:hypothetical protein [Nisaea nitritireducens]|uniref:hypothetical protein n=1 Tax=Nisaea nitritireducens TaxID=568392 RepID=UPI00186738E4|nr:hypothetical protein [Nisaea nitritireducens]